MTKATHKAEYHSGGHGFIYQGSLVRVHRRNDGKIPCPCGREDHARYSFKKLTAINKQDPHPISDASEWADHLPDVKHGETVSRPPFPPNPTNPSPEANTEISEQNGQNATQDLQSSHSPIASAPQSPAPGEAFPPSTNSAPTTPPTVDIGHYISSALSEGLRGESGDMKDPNEETDMGIKVAGIQDVGPMDDTGESHKDGSSTDDEEGSNEGDYSSDDDAEPVEGDQMDVDHAPVSLSAPEILSSLSRLNILVEPVYHLAVCTECAIPVRLEHMHTHQRTKHFKGLTLPPELRLPSRSELTVLLATLGADQPLEVPAGPIPRIQGVQVVQGLKCTMSGCVGEVFGAVEGRSRNLRVHQLQVHPQVALADRRSIHVQCHPLSANRKDRRFVEITPTSTSTSTSFRFIEKAAETCNLLEHSEVFTLASNEREKNAVFAQSRWDEVLDGVHLTSLMATISTPKRDAFVSFKRLKLIARGYYKEVTERLPTLPVLTRRYLLSSSTSNLKHQPFRRPQDMKTIIEDSDRTSQFIAFLIVHIETPVDGFPIPLHPEVTAHLKALSKNLANESAPESELGNAIHDAVWLLLSRPSDEYIQNELMCPFTRFIISATLKESGTFVRAKVITPVMAQAQWCFRATAAEEIIRVRSAYNGDSLLAYKTHVERYLTDGHTVLFTTLRQNMNFLRALASRQQGLARFNWNIERTVISIDGFPIPVSSYINGVHNTIKNVSSQIDHLFRGCNYSDILQLIDDAMVPAQSGQPRWFRDRPTGDKIRYSFFEEPENGLQEHRPRLLNHLIEDPKLFTAVDEKLIPKNGAILKWFGELDDVVRGLYYLVSTTWGGGSRGTEIEHLLYANHPRNLRNVFIINGLLTIVTEYQKTQSIAGAGKLIARTPAFHVNRLLILVLGVAYWAAGYIGCYIGMEKLNCQRYFYEVFVLTGKSMESKDFSKVLRGVRG
ncbi:hypothetical protein F5051DRAFT_439914 [Lentinula edodes]|nr:hypothetical protein F5051DRAFT_439914 [Lentinula edodes]